jgi:hypothetical protein
MENVWLFAFSLIYDVIDAINEESKPPESITPRGNIGH